MPPKDLQQPSPEDVELPNQANEEEAEGQLSSYDALVRAREDYFSSQGVDLSSELWHGREAANVMVISTINLDDEARKKLPAPLKEFANFVYARNVKLQSITLRSARYQTRALVGPPVNVIEDFILDVEPEQHISEVEQSRWSQGFTGIIVSGKEVVRDGWFNISTFRDHPVSKAFVAEYDLKEWLGLSNPEQENKGPGTPAGFVGPEVERALTKVIADPSIGVRTAPMRQ